MRVRITFQQNPPKDELKRLLILQKSAKLKPPNSRIAVSALTQREDLDRSAKLCDAKFRLKTLSESHNFTFIDNSRIDNSCLKYSKGT